LNKPNKNKFKYMHAYFLYFYIFIFSILYFLFYIVFGTGPSSAHGDWAGLDPSGPAWPLAQASGQAAFTRQSA